MYRLLLGVAVSLLAVALGAQEQKTCDQMRFLSCSAGLATHLGPPFTASNIWIDAMDFRLALNQLFSKGDVSNIVKICNGLEMFYACLGPSLPVCMGVHGLVGQQMNPYMAYAYEGFMNMWRFQCGAGFYGAEKIGAVSCVQRTVLNLEDKLLPLLVSYRSNVEHDSNQGCSYAKKLSRAYQEVFVAGPCAVGFAKFGGWWGCEGQNEYSIAQFPECGQINQCDYESVNAINAPEHVRFVEGQMLVKIDETWVKDAHGRWNLEPEKWI